MKHDFLYLPRIKEQLNLLLAMSHKTDELGKKFHELIGKLVISKNSIVKYVVLQMLAKYGIPDDLESKVLAECSNDTILFQEPDKITFPHMISTVAQLAIAKKYKMQESYRTHASYFDRKLTFEFIKKFLGKDNEYDALVKKYKIADEDVPADLSSTKKLIADYLICVEIKKREEMRQQILAAPGSWDALRQSGRKKTDAERQILLQLADDISRKIKVIHHFTQDEKAEKILVEINKIKGKSLNYAQLADFASTLMKDFKLHEITLYTERLADGKGTRLLVYTMQSPAQNANYNYISDIVSARYTRNNVSRLVDLSKITSARSKMPLLKDKIIAIAEESKKYVTSCFEFYLHLHKY